jgi:16S rRNA (adenine1518-N6/adenine1519-N6)-dimethyltransferase
MTARPRRPHGGRPSLPAPPRKSLGQHFLRDEMILDRIVRESGVEPEDTVLEIGPGTGELTDRLLRAARRVVAVEIDETLSRHVRRRFADAQNLAVVNAAVLDHTPAELLAEGKVTPPYKVVANIPYYITAPILRTFLESDTRPTSLTLMVQREVAESIVAGPGKMSLMAVSVQFYAEARLLFTVPPIAFYPPPKVASAVVRIDVRERPAVDVADVDQFFDVVRAGFAQPRKQLHNAIAGRLWLPPDSAPEVLRAAGIDPMRRAQTLSLDEWATLARAVQAAQDEARTAQQSTSTAERAADAAT